MLFNIKRLEPGAEIYGFKSITWHSASCPLQCLVTKQFDVRSESILKSVRGKENIPRWVAMYLCQEIGGHRLIDIASKFGLKRTGSIPVTLAKLKCLLEKDKELQKNLNSSI